MGRKNIEYKCFPLEQDTLEKMQFTSKPDLKDLENYHIDKLVKALKYASKNSKFYAEHLKSVNIQSIKSYNDLSKINYTNSDDIINFGKEMLCIPAREISRVTSIKTSGTSGKYKRIYFTENDLKSAMNFFIKGSYSTDKNAKRIFICLPGDTEGSTGDLFSKAMTQAGRANYVFGAVNDYDAAIKAMKKFKPDSIIGLPYQILQLAKLTPDFPIKVAYLTSDYVPQVLYDILFELWHCDVLDHYGISECGFGAGVYCNRQNGYHLRHGDLLFEIVDPETGARLPYGKYGEVVFSTLDREAMPLFRYKTGDISRLLTEPCACGGVLPRLDKHRGRLQNIIKVDDETISIHKLDEILFAHKDVLDYTVELKNTKSEKILIFSVKSIDKLNKNELKYYLKSKLPKSLKIIVEKGDSFYSIGTKKRHILENK